MLLVLHLPRGILEAGFIEVLKERYKIFNLIHRMSLIGQIDTR
jgi:hypothetical protein